MRDIPNNILDKYTTKLCKKFPFKEDYKDNMKPCVTHLKKVSFINMFCVYYLV